MGSAPILHVEIHASGMCVDCQKLVVNNASCDE